MLICPTRMEAAGEKTKQQIIEATGTFTCLLHRITKSRK